MWDLLRFHTFVTPWVLLGVYYMGALLMPLGIYYLMKRLGTRIEGGSTQEPHRPSAGETEQGDRPRVSRGWKLRLVAVAAWLMGELAWRIFIEFFVAYFQMREALAGS